MEMAQAPARVPRGPSLRPALVVVAVAVAIVAIFGLGSLFHGGAPPARQAPVVVPASPLPSIPAGHALRPIEISGAPPRDVLASVVLPRGASVVSASPWNRTTQFSASMGFGIHQSQERVIDFYRLQLRARGWSIQDVGPARGAHGAIEVLAQRASSDGWFWEMGVVVSPTSFTPKGAETTRFSLELFQKTDTT